MRAKFSPGAMRCSAASRFLQALELFLLRQLIASSTSFIWRNQNAIKERTKAPRFRVELHAHAGILHSSKRHEISAIGFPLPKHAVQSQRSQRPQAVRHFARAV